MGLLWFLFCIFRVPEVFEQISPELHVASTQKCLLPSKYGHDPDWKGASMDWGPCAGPGGLRLEGKWGIEGYPITSFSNIPQAPLIPAYLTKRQLRHVFLTLKMNPAKYTSLVLWAAPEGWADCSQGCREVGACHLWDWKSSSGALLVQKVAVLSSGEGKPHAQCDQVLFLLICGRMSGHEQAQRIGTLCCALHACLPAWLLLTSLSVAKTVMDPVFLSPEFVEVGGKGLRGCWPMHQAVSRH